jgi:hypothetical protein
MRGGLDDALARMARMEEMRRRAAEPAANPGATQGFRHRAAEPPATPGAVVEELVQAARGAVARDRELSITVTVAYRGRTSAVRVERLDGEVTVTVVPAQPREVEAAPPEPPEPPSAASQLAELLRQSKPE